MSAADYDADPDLNVTLGGVQIDHGLTPWETAFHIRKLMADLKSPTFAGLTVDTDTLYVDSINNRVGIKTTSPEEELHIKSTTIGPQALVESTVGTASFAVRNSIATPGADTELGKYVFQGLNDASVLTAYGQLRGFVTDDTAGSEDGYMALYWQESGALAERIRFSSGGISFDAGTTVFNTVKRMTFFAPVIADAGTGGNTGSITANNSYWSQVDKHVHVYLDFTIDSTTGMTLSNDLYIRMADLPNAHNSYSGPNGIGFSQGAQISVMIEKNVEYIRLWSWVVSDYRTISAATTGDSTIQISFTYDAS